MRAQQYIIRYLLVAALAVVFIAASMVFIRWLYWDNSPDTAAGNADNYEGTIDRYSDNLYINIINNTIPAAKVGYENKYGHKLNGLTASLYGNIINGMNFDIRDPKTYFSFVFTAFSQYDPNSSTVALEDAASDEPKITSFEEAPEGEIYFDELEEINAEAAADAQGLPTSDPLDAGEAIVIEDPERIEIEKKQPSVLILHTHSTETYTPYNANNFHSINDKENLISVGKILTDVLESKYKYNVIHDTTKHDRYSYADSYVNSKKTILSQLEKHKSIKVIMDVHRDAFEIKTDKVRETRKNEYTAKINGKNAARIMLVIGPGNKNFEELKKFAVYVQKKMDKLYPGLYYKTVIKPRGTYNQSYRDHTLLVEIGCTLNSDQEAKYSAELLGNVMGEVMKDLEQ